MSHVSAICPGHPDGDMYPKSREPEGPSSHFQVQGDEYPEEGDVCTLNMNSTGGISTPDSPQSVYII